jgi:hypothetical protein
MKFGVITSGPGLTRRGLAALFVAMLCACGSSGDQADEGRSDVLDAALDAAGLSPLDAGPAPSAPGFDAAIITVPACKLGQYTGTFTCTYSMFPDGGAGLFDFNVNTPVSGGVTLRLKPASGGAEFEAVGSGELSGNAELLYDFQATLEGTLNCTSGHYKGMLTGGKASFFGIEFLDFKGDFGANYDGDAGRLEGQWTLNVLTGGACVGSWNATYAGP